MFRASTWPSSRVLGWIQTYTQCTSLHTGSSGPQPQHLVLNAIGSSIQPNTPEDGCRCPKHGMFSFFNWYK